MVDFSCALKLAMPLAVLSAMREASQHHITVKGGKFLEAVAEAETIVFDKTGTLTKAKPVVSDVVSFNGMEKEELLRIAAWKSIFRTRWQMRSYRKRKNVIWYMKRCTREWITS